MFSRWIIQFYGVFIFAILSLTGIRILWAADPAGSGFWEQDIEDAERLKKLKTGLASWYGGRFHGRKTASGERYNKHDFTCASKTLPFGTVLQVTNLKNGRSAIVRVNDRGPYRKKRILDLSYAVAKQLGFLKSGVTQIAYSVISHPE